MTLQIPNVKLLVDALLAKLLADTGVQTALPGGVFYDYDYEVTDRYAVVNVLQDSFADVLGSGSGLWEILVSIRCVASGSDSRDFAMLGDNAIAKLIHHTTISITGFQFVGIAITGNARGYTDQHGSYNYVRFYKIWQQG